ncbi:MAG: hypothetical protein GY869_29210 [Planctomycetes bacterium]|nr:hypothetical protein [Planctomycetota bacterium]
MAEEDKTTQKKEVMSSRTSKVRFWISLVLILVGGWYAIQSGRMVYNYSKFTNEISDFLSVVPVEEEWQASTTGKRASMGFMTLVFEPNQVAGINANQDAVRFILADGMVLSFQTPTTDPEKDGIEDLSHFEKKKASCFTKPASWWGYLAMSVKEKEEHLQQLAGKSIKYNQKGIVIFEGAAVRGIYRKGAVDEPLMFCDVWGKESKMFQTVIIQGPEEELSAEQEKVIEEIVGSMEYTEAEMPNQKDYMQLILAALQNSEWAKKGQISGEIIR